MAKAIPVKRPGSTLTARDINRLSEAAGMVFNIRSDSGRVSTLGDSLTIRDYVTPAPDPETMAFSTNASGLIVKPFSLVKFNGMDITFEQFTTPPYSGFSFIGLTTQFIYPAGAEWIRHTGFGIICYSRGTVIKGGSVVPLAVGDRLGCKQDKLYAQFDQLGPLLVIDPVIDDELDLKLAAQWIGADYKLAFVLITRQRGDHKIADADDVQPAASGSYQTYIWSSKFAVAKAETGITSVTIA